MRVNETPPSVTQTARETSKEDVSHGTKKLSLLKFSVMLYLLVSGGPFGVESSVRSAGPMICLIGLTLIPLFYCLPQSLMCAELSSMMPSNLGYILWVYRGLDYLNTSVMNVTRESINDCSLDTINDFKNHDFNFFSDLFGEIHCCSANSSSKSDEFNIYWQINGIGQFLIKLIAVLSSCMINLMKMEDVGHISSVITLLVLAPYIIGFVINFHQIDPSKQWVFGRLIVNNNGDGKVEGSTKDIEWSLFLSGLIWLYTGWDTIGCLAGEADFAPKQFITSFCLSIFFIWFFYVLSVIAALTTYDSYTSLDAWHSGYLATAYDSIWHPYLGISVTVAALLSSFSEYTIELSAQSRALWAMAQPNIIILEDGSLHVFTLVSKTIAVQPKLNSVNFAERITDSVPALPSNIRSYLLPLSTPKDREIQPLINPISSSKGVTQMTSACGASIPISSAMNKNDGNQKETMTQLNKADNPTQPGIGGFLLSDTCLAISSVDSIGLREMSTSKTMNANEQRTPVLTVEVPLISADRLDAIDLSVMDTPGLPCLDRIDDFLAPFASPNSVAESHQSPMMDPQTLLLGYTPDHNEKGGQSSPIPLTIESDVPIVHRSDRVIPVSIAPEWTRLHTISERTGQPTVSVISVSVCSLILSNLQFNILVQLSVFFNVYCWILEYASFLALKYREPEADRPFAVPGGLKGAWLITLVKSLVIGFIFVLTIYERPLIALLSFACLISACLWYYLRRRDRSVD